MASASPPFVVPHTLVLRAWEAVSTERSLQGVLSAVSDVLAPVVPFDGVALVSLGPDGDHLMGAHVRGHAYREGESAREYLGRPELAGRPRTVPQRPVVPYDESVVARAFAGEPYSCPDLLAKDAWYEHEFQMVAGGIRAYCSVPLMVRSALIGTAAFTRLEPTAFSASELFTLKAVARALAVAVSNAIAYDEITRLRDGLEAENLELRTELDQSGRTDDLVGSSDAMRAVIERIGQVAATPATVLITGETGTGKELVARAIHRRSGRARAPLIKVNCAAIPEALIASELFGHERGAFTGAHDRRRGRFELADGGTIFLDEIGELTPEMQVALLRVLQEREFERLGGADTIRVDVRVIAATNRDLAEDVRTGRFRADLYYRLNVFPVHVPPLRERPEDVALLVGCFTARYSARSGKALTRVSARTLRQLTDYVWPGNVRELENVIERAVIVSRGETLRIERGLWPESAPGGATLADTVQQSERSAIEAALTIARGRISGPRGAAARLDMPASTLEFRIRKLGIDKWGFKAQGRRGA